MRQLKECIPKEKGLVTFTMHHPFMNHTLPCMFLISTSSLTCTGETFSYTLSSPLTFPPVFYWAICHFFVSSLNTQGFQPHILGFFHIFVKTQTALSLLMQ
jgi:hypothetical protein